MIEHIYKPKGSRIWRWKFRLRPKDGKIEDVSLETSDKQVAEKKRSDLLREREHERAGFIPAKAAREAAQRSLKEHLENFCRDLVSRGKSKKYLANIEFRVGRLIDERNWQTAKEVTADSFQAWRCEQRLSAKTANDYLEAARCLFNWMVKHGRAGTNPLTGVEKVRTEGRETRERRAFSDEEMGRLLSVAGDRKAVYLMAVHTGLRRSELAALKWSDVSLDAVMPFVQVRASTTKNGKAAAMRVHPELVGSLRELKEKNGADGELVFTRFPRIERFRRDLQKADIGYRDAEGRVADFHSLRKTFGTNLARAGVASRVAMALMRHSDRRLTDKIYTDENLLGTWSAIDSLPNYSTMASQGASQIASQKIVAGGHGESQPVITGRGAVLHKGSMDIGESRVLALSVTEGQDEADGGSGGARTRNLCRDRAAL